MGIKETIKPKSDQLNSDDLIAGPMTIKVTGVRAAGGDQPVSIFFEGDNGKPYKPCLSMRRVMVKVWGDNEELYAGRFMTLYRDDSVKWAGEEVGGIRISHMTNISEPVTLKLTANKQQRKPFTVHPLLGVEADDPMPGLEEKFNALISGVSEDDAKNARDFVDKNSTPRGYVAAIKRLEQLASLNGLEADMEEDVKGAFDGEQ